MQQHHNQIHKQTNKSKSILNNKIDSFDDNASMADSSNHEDASSINSNNSHSNLNNNNDHYFQQSKQKTSNQNINSILNPKPRQNISKQVKNVRSLYISNPTLKKYFQHKVKIIIALIKIVDYATNRSR